MTEVEATTALASVGDTMCSFTGLWVSVTFAYLTVAYFVGRDLSRFQNMAVSGLYGVSALLFSLGALVHAEAWLEIAVNSQTVYKTISTSPLYSFVMPTFVLILGVGISVSFYFMYNVRHSAEPESGE